MLKFEVYEHGHILAIEADKAVITENGDLIFFRAQNINNIIMPQMTHAWAKGRWTRFELVVGESEGG